MSSLYPPDHHQCNNRQKQIEVIKHFPLGMLVSVENDKPLTEVLTQKEKDKSKKS